MTEQTQARCRSRPQWPAAQGCATRLRRSAEPVSLGGACLDCWCGLFHCCLAKGGTANGVSTHWTIAAELRTEQASLVASHGPHGREISISPRNWWRAQRWSSPLQNSRRMRPIRRWKCRTVEPALPLRVVVDEARPDTSGPVGKSLPGRQLAGRGSAASVQSRVCRFRTACVRSNART